MAPGPLLNGNGTTGQAWNTVTPSATDLKSQNAAQDKRDAFHAELPSHNLRGLWHNEMRPMTGLPDTSCIPHLWPWKEQRDVIMRSQEVTTTSEAERRAMIMVNPGVGICPYTTDTILGAWQLLLPGERALCHRHTIFAIRFLIEGKGGYTAVAGKKMYMERGDLILTTQFDWHDHGNDGDEPIIWLDGLDMPMFAGSFPINFQMRYMEHQEHLGERYHPSSVSDNSPIQYKWSAMKERLDKEGGDYTRLEYKNSAFADGHISRTIAAFADRINAGASSPLRQETCNNIFHVVSGSGETIVTKGQDQSSATVLKWNEGDTFCVPSWFKFEHIASQNGTAYLFNYNDLSALEKLGFYSSAF